MKVREELHAFGVLKLGKYSRYLPKRRIGGSQTRFGHFD
jgi:hypothetical protein